MKIERIAGVVQHYQWGGPTTIPQLLGRQNPKQTPWAEYWLGTHSRGHASLDSGVLLKDRLNGEALPFLLKILSATQPLSIQCHPNQEQARAGFAAEEEQGIPISDFARVFRDQNHKPELIVALEDFWALQGFREEPEIQRLLQSAGVFTLLPGLQAALAQGPKSLLKSLLAMPAAQAENLGSTVEKHYPRLPADIAYWLSEIAVLYPDDPLRLAPLFLRLVCLSPGQALFLGPGQLHSYLRGTGIELMASSDNVLRAGLSSKHVDPDRLLSILDEKAGPSAFISPERQGPEKHYRCSAEEFELVEVSLANEPHRYRPQGPELWLCLGSGTFATEIQSGSKGTQAMSRGDSFLCTEESDVWLQGEGSVWIARRPSRIEDNGIEHNLTAPCK